MQIKPDDIALIDAIKQSLGISSLDKLKPYPQGGLFGAHPLRGILLSERLTPESRAECNALLDDLALCELADGFTKVKKSLRVAKNYWSARFQLALAGRLLHSGHRLRFEAVVDRERRVVESGAASNRARRDGHRLTEVDIPLLDAEVDIEVCTRREQFFLNFDPEVLATLEKPLINPDEERQIICDVRLSSLVQPERNEFHKVEEFFREAIPAIIRGSEVSTYTHAGLGIEVKIRTGILEEQKCDRRDTVGLAFGNKSFKTWLHLCYQDETPLERFFEDLQGALGSVHFGGRDTGKMTQLRKYPGSRKHVLAIGFPHTLIRFAEGDDKARFRNGVVERVSTWMESKHLHENRLDRRVEPTIPIGSNGPLGPALWHSGRSSSRSFVKALLLMEFGHFEDMTPTSTLYRYPVLIGNEPEIEVSIAQLEGWSNV